jgi:iron complex outermembrane receptor protein
MSCREGRTLPSGGTRSRSRRRFGTYHEAIDSTGPLSEACHAGSTPANTVAALGRARRLEQLAISGSIDSTPRRTCGSPCRTTSATRTEQVLGTPVLNNAPVEGLRYINYNVADAKLNFTDDWTNLETIWTPSPALSFHNNTFFMYHDRIYRDVPTYAYVPATNKVRRTQFRDINDTYETQVRRHRLPEIQRPRVRLKNDVLVGLD